MEPEDHDNLILTTLQYTANRLLILSSASRMDEEGQAYWLTDLQVHRLIGTFAYGCLWTVPPDMPNNIILLASAEKFGGMMGGKGLTSLSYTPPHPVTFCTIHRRAII
jgi:hypothetical protein